MSKAKKNIKRCRVTHVEGRVYPRRIGHNYIPVVEEPLELLYDKYNKHQRLRVFANKGCRCVICGVEGTRLITGQEENKSTRHVDLYTSNFMLMTVDHRIPRSKGGTDDLSNLDPMCERCNCKKGTKDPSEVKYNEFFIKVSPEKDKAREEVFNSYGVSVSGEVPESCTKKS